MEKIEQDDTACEQAIIDLENYLQVKVMWCYTTRPFVKKENKTKSDEYDSEDDEDDEEPHEQVVNVKYITKYEGELILHWGVFYGQKHYEWNAPPAEIQPPKTKHFDSKAVQTPFSETSEMKEEGYKMMMECTIPRGQGIATSIGGLNFVFYDPQSKKWYNNQRKDYSIKFKLKVDHRNSMFVLIQKQLEVPCYVSDIINCEVNYGSWTLMHRYNKCHEILNSINLEDTDSLAWLYIWLRYSYQRQLDWQRNYNTKPRDLAGSMNSLTYEITKKYAELLPAEQASHGLRFSSSNLLKQMLSLLGKGAGNGQQIRDEILVIMHKHHIKETNDHFYEQWHQKLHNNTTPDDIVICQALLKFLKSGNIEDYRHTLQLGGISKQRLENFDRKITLEPTFQPEYIEDFEHFLITLKSVHSSTDLVLMYESAKSHLSSTAKFDEIITNKDDWDTIKQIWRVTEGRSVLDGIIKHSLKDINILRDLLFFEIALEVYLRQLVEKIIHLKVDFKYHINEISSILKNIIISYPQSHEFQLCYDDWISIAEPLKTMNSIYGYLKMKSVCDRLSRLLTHVIDQFNIQFDSKAKYFGNECGIDKYYTDLFSEEAIRGSIFFALSILLKKVEPILRKNANLGSWIIISRGNGGLVTGTLRYVKSLQEVQMETFKEKTVLVTEIVGGNEEIPGNCQCVIMIKTSNYPDILSHVSVRARNLEVEFAICFDEATSNQILQLLGNHVKVKINNQSIDVSLAPADSKSDQLDDVCDTKIKTAQSLPVTDGFQNITLELNEFSPDYVGSKAFNTKKVFGCLPSWVKYPESFAIPYNVNEYFLELDENKEIKEELGKLMESIKQVQNEQKEVPGILERCRNLTREINFVSNTETEKLRKRLYDFGIEEKDINRAFKSIKSVWASKYNDRAYIATQKVGISIQDIRMAVLVQKIIPADYAFVIHTKNPSTNDEGEVYAEMVVGMGESLVGSYEGQSFSFTLNKKTKIWEIKSYPNKSVALRNQGFIFRSDSNTEDLEGFAGAGLFDSVPMVDHKVIPISYGKDPIFKDQKFAETVILKIGVLGMEVENFYKYPQDIEGVLFNNQFYIIQTRPQV